MIDAGFKREGDLAFPVVETEEKKEEAAPAPVVETAAPAAEAVPFHEDPKVQEYIERQLDKRTEAVEKKLREEFGSAATPAAKTAIDAERERNAADTQIPPWFGGNQEQWDAYRGWLDGKLQALGEQTVTKTFETAQTRQSETDKAQKEATDHFNNELKAITADKTLNPSGKPIDPAALLKAAVDNELVDTKGRWNYRAAARFLNTHSTAVHANNKEKKDVAAATIDGAGGASGGEPAAKNFKTPADFRKKRPW